MKGVSTKKKKSLHWEDFYIYTFREGRGSILVYTDWPANTIWLTKPRLSQKVLAIVLKVPTPKKFDLCVNSWMYYYISSYLSKYTSCKRGILEGVCHYRQHLPRYLYRTGNPTYHNKVRGIYFKQKYQYRYDRQPIFYIQYIGYITNYV